MPAKIHAGSKFSIAIEIKSDKFSGIWVIIS